MNNPRQLLRRYVDLQAARRTGRAPRSLTFLSIEIIQDCNAHCAMCGYPTDYPKGERLLSEAELNAVIDEAASAGTLLISLGGGEPFLRPDAERLIARIVGQGMNALVHSNGSLITPSRLRRLAELRRLVMSFSVDYPTRAEHDRQRGVPCFNRIMTASTHIASAPGAARVAWICTVTRQNAGRLLAIMQLAHDVGVRTVRFTPVHDNLQHRFKAGETLRFFGLGEKEKAVVADQVERVLDFAGRKAMVTNSAQFLRGIPDAFRGRIAHRCAAGFLFCVLDPYGSLMPCYDHGPGIDLRAAGGLMAALESPAMDALRRRVLACGQRCWNIGTAEPSLRVDPANLLRQGVQLAREALFFLR